MNVKDSVAATKAARAERDAKEALSRELRDRITAELPDHIQMPTISNESLKAFFGQPGMWLSFSRRDYDKDAMDPVFTLKSMEDAGFRVIPASLCQWEHYTPSAHPGRPEDIPDTRRGGFGSTDTLNSVEEIAPLWITMSFPHSRYAKANVFMMSPSGLTVKVMLDVPFQWGAPRITARRVEHGDHVTYENIGLVFPPAWEVVYNGGNSVAQRQQNTRAYRSTESSASAYLYWTMLVEREDFPFTPSEFLAVLMATNKGGA